MLDSPLLKKRSLTSNLKQINENGELITVVEPISKKVCLSNGQAAKVQIENTNPNASTKPDTTNKNSTNSTNSSQQIKKPLPKFLGQQGFKKPKPKVPQSQEKSTPKSSSNSDARKKAENGFVPDDIKNAIMDKLLKSMKEKNLIYTYTA